MGSRAAAGAGAAPPRAGPPGPARAAIGRAVDEAGDRAARPPLLAAAVEIALAGGDVASARAAADRLAGIADALDAPILRAMAAEARGAVLAAEGEVSGALAALRGAWTAWHRLPAPYAAARVRVLIAAACRAAGDEDSALMEMSAAAAPSPPGRRAGPRPRCRRGGTPAG